MNYETPQPSEVAAPAETGEADTIDAAYVRLVAHLTRLRDQLATGEITPTGDYDADGDWPLVDVLHSCWFSLYARGGERPPVTLADLQEIDDLLRDIPGLSATALTEFIDYTLPDVHKRAVNHSLLR